LGEDSERIHGEGSEEKLGVENVLDVEEGGEGHRIRYGGARL